MITLAYDVLGSDLGPRMIASGIDLALLRGLDAQIIAVGPEGLLSEMRQEGSLHPSVKIVHCDIAVTTKDDIRSILREGNSSVAISAKLVATGMADGFVSFGDTRAAVACARNIIGTLEGIKSTPLAVLMPTGQKLESGQWRTVVQVDAGANTTNCNAQMLVEFAHLGWAFAKSMFEIDTPRIGVLANGEEDEKGTELTRQVLELLSDFPGFKRHAQFSSVAELDVLVCHGYEGNIGFKGAEWGLHTALAFLGYYLKHGGLGDATREDLTRLIGAIISAVDPGCQPLLGPKQFVGIGHGGADKHAVERSVRTAAYFAALGYAEKMQHCLNTLTA